MKSEKSYLNVVQRLSYVMGQDLQLLNLRVQRVPKRENRTGWRVWSIDFGQTSIIDKGVAKRRSIGQVPMQGGR